MTITNTDPFTTSVNTGVVETDYTFGFLIGEGDENTVLVQLTDANGNITYPEYTTDYTVTRATEPAVGGTVNLLVEPSAGSSIVLYRSTELTQARPLPNQGPFKASTIEDMADKLTMIAQEAKRDQDLTLSLPIGTDTSAVSLVMPEPVDGRSLVGVTENGVTRYSSDGLSQTTIEAATATAVADATASATASAATATTKAAEASTSATDAETAATDAETAATDAETAATNAETSETNAAASAVTATDKAAEAAASAASFVGGGPALGDNSIVRYNSRVIKSDVTFWEDNLTCTVDATADTVSRGTDDDYENGDIVQFATDGTLPAGLTAGTDYYVRDVTTATFKVATSGTGAAIDITDTGTGTHTVYKPVNGSTVGPIEIADGATVNIKDGSTWSIV